MAHKTTTKHEHTCWPLQAGNHGLIATCNAHFGQQPPLREGIKK